MRALMALAATVLLGASLTANGAENPVRPRVKMETTKGDIVVELNSQAAPKTVANFVQYVKDGFYNGTIFHRVIKGFMIQGGGLTKDMEEKTTRTSIVNEADNGLKNMTGTIAMARKPDPNSATAQFFINVKDNIPLNFRSKDEQGYGYCVFGRVVSGMNVVTEIENTPTGFQGGMQDVPQTPVIITKASLVGAAKAEPKGASASPKSVKAGSDTVTTSSGLKYIVVRKGSGPKPSKGTNVKVHYTGKFPDGKVFDSSVQRGQPFEFSVGSGMVIAGWDEAVLDMTKGEKRTLIVPPSLGYGERGAAGVIPPNATLIFDVELLDF
jgi:peptidyl-prolyl cis-trans isomerase B (cyclophilin B)